MKTAPRVITPSALSLLDRAIEEHRIPPCPFQAEFDRIVVYSVPEDKAKRETFVPEGKIIKLETRTAMEQAETPRGVIVSAGLVARDVLRSHGMGLGHMVWVARLSPWRYEFERDSEGRVVEMLFLRVGDIVGSETLREQIASNQVVVEAQADGTHRFKYNDEDARPRFDPPSYVA